MSAKQLMWLVAGLALAAVGEVSAQVAIRAKTLWTMDQAGPIKDGVVVIAEGRIAAVGAATTPIPAGYRVIEVAVATPGLIDARGTVGVSGLYNQSQDQDQLDRSGPMQPELRAIDAFNPLDPLVGWVRSLGVTTANTGHAPGELMSGQTCVVKLNGRPVDEAVLRETSAVTVTLGPWAEKSGKESPGTRAKMVSMLRQELIKAREYAAKREKGEATEEQPSEKEGERDKPKGRDLRLEQMARVLKGEVPLLITCNRSQDIAGALRLAEEFKIRVILDSASESYLLIDQIKRANVPVIIHPTMFRMFGEMQNMSLETASTLTKAGIPVAMQSGFEAYVPKTRVVLFEAAQAAANGLTVEQALATCTSNAADILGVADRVGRLRPGLDGDVALYDGDPFEWTSHCLGVVIDGRVYDQEPK